MADQVDIFARLKADHDRHRELLEQIESAEGVERGPLFEAFRIEVTAHAAAEEETLYATMLGDPELRHDAQHSVSEHKEIGDFLEEMQELDPASSDWARKFADMRHRYTHHIDEEEEDMFPVASDELADAVLGKLGPRFDERKPAEVARAERGEDEDDDRD